MQAFVKLILFVLIINNAKAQLKLCDNENSGCSASKSEGDPPGTKTTDMISAAEPSVKYLLNFSKRCDHMTKNMTEDIDFIKNSLKTGNKQLANCSYTLKQLASTKATEAPPSLYENLWVVIQRRQEGAVSFYRLWYHYKQGFGNPFREFFIGLDKIHYLTNSAPHELLIKLEDFKGNIKYALYDDFLVGNETEKFQLKKLGAYSGNAGDYMRNHEGMYFSTKDRDNDASDDLHCAKRYQAGWWYNNCLTSNLNGPFRTRYAVSNIGITWGKPDAMQIKIVQMMLRLKRL